ncbi:MULTISPECIES: hypothetical protein [Bacillaceae]|jgi:hypothetical protein|uniref:DUF3139 domain-containing protein n=1 Tax=Gottfriedia luciferensis TaxID=178774 RepID=A0ABX2ZUD0_9BACI|nr:MULTISPECIES: hypothetical protein [Bacillaceae]ODG93391.1 hypothetical protein BED47_03630 [Gottfriedia luciferensis]PGZ88773.1 hypothetical protein COE53_19460 [Bacillus sp. AFS029533]SFC48307.1 hypothetical protein SAMN02799633_00954 [Bacillus sp. UNCCL81]
MKKIGKFVLIFIIFIGIGFSYIQYKKSNVEKSVTKYLTTEKNISKNDIISSEPFIANLQGDKNWMVSIKLKNDDKTYYYYKSKNKVILESYVENGEEHVQ